MPSLASLLARHIGRFSRNFTSLEMIRYHGEMGVAMWQPARAMCLLASGHGDSRNQREEM